MALKLYKRQIVFYKKTKWENAPRKRIVALTSTELRYYKKYGNVEPYESRIIKRAEKR